ncbi:MAG: DEAD/DEAH box helicase [Patescibacteria group bacterium]|nr:DEAD/DEAH box helicase [Patescibacteria group bacterium]
MLKKEIQITPSTLSFADLGIKESILKIISDLGLVTPTPIQHQAIPAALSGQDLVGIAQTGTGKTFAFGIPMLQRLAQVKGRGLVLLPTRELAGQVETSLRSLGGLLGLRTVSLIGGEAINRQLFALRRQPHILVATPGRLIDHIKRGTVKLDDISVLVLDEADMMFDMGFAPQIEEVLKRVPAERQTLLFSATMPAAVMKLAEKYLHTPIRVEVSPAGSTAKLVEQEILILPRDARFDQLLLLLDEFKGSVLIFVRTKHGATKLTKKLLFDGFKAAEIHSNLSFAQRQAALAGFKSGLHRILVATDVAARGLDINDIELVLNFDLPDNSEDYVHRIGRTARAGKKGKAISFASSDQYREIQKIERLIQKNLPVKNIGSSVNRPRVESRDELDSSRRNFPAKKFGQNRNFNRPNSSASKFQDNRRPKASPARTIPAENYSSLGFRKRAAITDVTATPDYLQSNESTHREALPVNKDFAAKRQSGFKSSPSSRFKTNNFKQVSDQKNNSRSLTTEKKVRKVAVPAVSSNDSPLIVNPEFDGGNRFAFRRKMFQLKEEAKGRPARRNTTARSSSSKLVKSVARPAAKPVVKSSAKTPSRPYKELKMGVRSSGFKVFKSKETMSGLEKKQEKAAKPAFKAKTFKPRFKKK